MPTPVQPFPMRSPVSDEAGELRISVPVKRGWVTLFLLVWLTFWTYGGLQIGRRLLRKFDPGEFIWMCFWVVTECAAAYYFLRMLFGRDLVVANASEFCLFKQILGIGPSKIYIVSQVRDLRFQPEVSGGKSRRASRIAFDYGARTISLAEEIEEAEAAALIDLIRSRCNIPQSSSRTETGTKFWQS